MKVLVLTEGGINIGFGHLSRCTALIQAIKSQAGNVFVDFKVKGDKNAKKFLSGKTVGRVSLFDWKEDENNILKSAEGADLVIIDSHLADKSLYESISDISEGKRVLMIDDYDRMEYPKGVVVRPSVYGDGKDYIILRKEFWEVPEKKINKDIKNILLTIANSSDLFKDILNQLKSKFSFSIEAIGRSKNRVGEKELLQKMMKADLCVSGGGQTTYELARCGVPTIAICFAKNQEENLNSLEKSGFLKNAGWYNDCDLLGRLEKKVEFFLPYQRRKFSSEVGKSLVDGKGAKRIIKNIL